MNFEIFCCLFLVFFCVANSSSNEDSTYQPACENGGAWSETAGCICIVPFTGSTCEKDPCIPNLCENNHTCEHGDEYDGFECKCMGMYTGKLCNEVLDPCYSNPCENRGTCEKEDDGFKCISCTDMKCEKITASPATSSTSFATDMGSTISASEEKKTITESIDTTSNEEETSSTESASSKATSENTISSTYRALSTTDKPSTIISQSSSITTSTAFASSDEESDTTKATQHDASSVKLTNSFDFDSSTLNPNISTSEKSKTVMESTESMSNEEEVSSPESASSKTTTENLINSTGQAFTSTKISTDKLTNSFDFESSTVNPNISISTSEESNTITESTNPTINEEEISSTESSASLETTTENLISSPEPTISSSIKTDNPNIIVSESSTITEFTILPSSKKAKDFTKLTQPHTTTVKLTNPAGSGSTTVDTNIFMSTSKESNKITETIGSTINEEESFTTKSTSSKTKFVSTGYPISFVKTTKIVDTVSSIMEESHKLTTKSFISTSTDDSVTKKDISAKKSSQKTVAYICGGTGGGLGLILLISGITYYLKRANARKQRQYFQRDDSSSMGSADSASRLA